MTNPKNDNTPPPAPAAQATEAEVQARINNVQEAIKKIEGEIKSIEGKIANNNPTEIAEIQAENNLLQGKVEQLENFLFALILEAYQGSQLEAMKMKGEVLRLSAVEYFKKANIKIEIWKNIES